MRIKVAIGKCSNQNLLFNPRNKDLVIELYLRSLEENITKMEVSSDKINNLTKRQCGVLYDLKRDIS